MAGNDDNVIEDDVVRISPDLTGFKRKLLADLKKEMAGVEATVKVRLVADKTGFARSVREQLRQVAQVEYKVKVVADTRDLARSVGKASKGAGGRGPKVKVGVEFDDPEADREFNKLYKRVRDNEEKVEQAEDQAHSTRFRRSRSFLEAVARDELAAYAMGAKRTRDAEAAKTGEVTKAAAQRARAAEQAARDAARNVQRIERDTARQALRDAEKQQAARNKTLFTSPQLIDFGGKGIKPMNLLYAAATALTPALFAVGSSALQASTSIAALGSAGIGAALGIGALVVAFQGIGDVLKLRTQVQNETTTAAANTKTAMDDLAQARRTLADAMRDEVTANADVHTSRLEAIRDLQNLRQSVKDLNNEYADDSLTLEEKKADEDRTLRNFFASSLDKRRAIQDRKNAEVELSDTALQRKQKTEDLKSSVSKGIEKSDRVLQSKERARDARDRVLDAQDALKKQQTAAAGGVDKTSSAAAQLKKKLAELSPAAREMYYWFDKNEELFKRLRNEIAQKTLPGFNQLLTAISTKPDGGGKTTLQLAADYAGQLGAIIGKYAGIFGKFTQSPFFRLTMAKIQERNARAFDTLGRAATTLMTPLLRIIDKASPGFESMADGIERFAQWFDRVIEKADKSGALTEWFNDARESAGKWFDLAKNIVAIVGNLFKAALPSGDSLLDQFLAFTENLKNLSGSESGQASIRSFFDKIAALPFAKIGDFFLQATAFFAVFRTARFLKSLNPFFLALSAFAASHPQAAAQAMEVLGNTLGGLISVAANNPAAVTGILGILAAAKIGKSIGFNIALPALDGIRNALTSKFKVLDKFVGGGANTATMTVHAGVVNVYGGAGIGNTPGSPVVPGAPGTPGTKGSKITRATNAVGTGSIVTAAAVIGYSIGSDEIARAMEVVSGDSKTGYHSWTDAISKKPFDWENWYQTFVDNSLLVTIPAIAKKLFGDGKPKVDASANTLKVIGAEQQGYSRLENNLQSFGKDSDVTKSSMDNYVAVRKARVKEYVDYVRSTQGPIAAAKVQQAEDKKSADAMSNLLQKYGWTKAAADVYTRQVFGLTEMTKKGKAATNDASVSFDSMGNSLKKTTTKAELLNQKSTVLKGTVNALVGDHVIALSTKNYDAVKKQLDMLYATQHVLYNPNYSNSASGADTVSSQNQFLDPKTGLPKKYMKATGGYIRGPGTATSDSIPARLSNGEYVMPTKTVQHYGLGVMEAMRKREVPGFAKGGAVMPFTVNLPTKGFQFPTVAYPSVGAGVASGDTNVAETAEATARAMGATTKQLVALIEAGLVESGLRNLNYGDRDSVGFLQQRAGWGSMKARMDVATATRKFISKARRVDNAGLSAGQLAQAVQVSAFPDRYAAREADAIAVINRAAPFLAGYGGSGGSQTGGNGTKAGLVAFGRWLQARGYRVSENSAFGGVTRGGHVNGSQHYRDNAIDVNHGAGTSKKEQSYLRAILPEAHRRGFRSIFMSPTLGHYDHAHFDLGAGHAKGGQVRKYDSGGVLPPGYTMAFNGTGRNETIRTHEQEKALQGPVRIDRRDIALLAAQLGAGGTPNVNLDGRRVAELTNRYNYLPAGV